MKVELVNNFGLYEELPVKSTIHNTLIYMSYMKLTLDKELVKEILINGQITSYEIEKNIIFIPCLFTVNNICIIEINYNDKNLKYTLKYNDSIEIDNKTIESLGEFYKSTVEWLGKGKVSIDSLIKAIDDGKINLLHIIDPLKDLNDDSFLEEIKKTIPFALNICTSPRQHLRLEDEILDIELVKKITPVSLKHLSSHSEHWKARTIQGLIPSRMLAQVYEDDINIYENVFFRIAIEKILLYISKKDVEVKKALIQKNILIDWEQYGNMLSDYRRGEILRKLLPEYDFEEEDFRREEFRELILNLESIERSLSSIISTSFYQSINQFKRIQFPIQPTNIIKMDNRYNQIFKLWNKLLELKINDKNINVISENKIEDISYYYILYVQALLIYGLSIAGLKKYDAAYIEILEGGLSKVHVCFYNKKFDIRCYLYQNNYDNNIRIDIIEKLNIRKKYPGICDLTELLKQFKGICELDPLDPSYIIFRKKPSKIVERKIMNIFKENKEYIEVLSTRSPREIGLMDKAWRKFFSDTVINFKEARKFTINIYPILASLGEDEIDLRKNTKKLLDSVINSENSIENTSNIFVMPVDLYKFEKVKNNKLISRLINYGESYHTDESTIWGNYKVGIIPISQTEINSTQRLIKLVSMNMTRLAIEWGLEGDGCPLCEYTDVIKIDSNTWKCKNIECGILWGTTRCTNGCGEEFSWTKPEVDITKHDLNENNPLKLILKKESIFDRLIITDFELIEENRGIKYIPKCPKCGHSSAKDKIKLN